MSLTKFPGFIDVHVHLREPGATHKEDFYTGTLAAIKGGFTYILDMPNNPIPTFSVKALKQKIKLSQKAICDVGFHFGSNGKNIASFPKVWKNPKVFGLKLYCNHTTGDYLVEDIYLLEQIFNNWKSEKPILVHAEGKELTAVIALTHLFNRRLHVCHISQAIEVELVKKAKEKKLRITGGVTPHHLFLSEKDVKVLGNFALVKPSMNSSNNQAALWEAVGDGTIDIVETDHAPHTIAEKKGAKPPFGIPGLETAVGLLFKAAKEKKLTQEKVIELIYDNPKRIFNIPDQPETYIELDPDKPRIVDQKELETKCGWSPFIGWELYAKVQTVVFRGRTLLKNGKLKV